MNGTWQAITTTIARVPIIGHQLAQVQPAQQAPLQQPLQQTGQAVGSTVNYSRGLLENLIAFIPSLLAALLVLLIGLIIAAIAKSITKGLLNRTNIDNRIAAGVMGRSDSGDLPRVENLIANIVFWVIVLFTAVAVLQTLNLQAVSQPLNNFLNLVLSFIPRLIGAALIFGVAWVIATVVKLITTRGLHALRLDERLDQRSPDEPREPSRMSLSETIGNALYWFIFLLFLIPVLDTLGLQQALLPVQNLVNEILLIIPNILAALLIAAAGWLLATVVRRIVTNLLASTGIDQLGSRFGLRGTRSSTTTQSLSGIIGTIVYVLILIPVAIAALNALRINAISIPAIAMLQQILNALPAIFTAAVILIAGYFLGRFVAELVTSILSSLGFDNIFSILGLPAQRQRPPADIRRTEEVIVVPPPSSGQETVLQPDATSAATAAALTTRTPSEIAGIVTLVGIMLFATVAAVNILNIPALTLLVSGLIVIFGRILSGLIVFAVGLFLANLAYGIITSSGNRQAQILGQVARIAIIVFVSALALQQIGIATEIVNLAFGLLLGAIAVAVAIAFGLGGRDIAAQQVREILSSFQEKRNQPPRQ